jgi:mono/diheme cytochrome c family protein
VTMRNRGLGLALMMGSALWIGCSEDTAPQAAAPALAGGGQVENTTPPVPEEPAAVLTPEELVEGGRSTYNANCTACHNIDATQDGALGPAVAGSSLALLEARVMRGKYPEGYEPKKATMVMVPLPHLEPRLNELTAYLGSLE